MAEPTTKLKEFEVELKALLKKHNVALDIKAEIVGVDLDKRPTPPQDPVALTA